MRLWLLGSGSKGNALLVECGDTRVLVDAGFSARRIAERLQRIGVDPASICALLLTHEHSDHVCGVEGAANRWAWPIYGTRGTLEALPAVGATTRTLAAGDSVTIGGLVLHSVRTSHDASDPVAYVATSQATGMRAAIVTDLGVVTEPVREAVRAADVLVVESNHDPVMLQHGPYPYYLKRRVAGSHGHLSNDAAGRLVTECAHRGLRQVVLAHLSETNNTPETAMASMQRQAKRARWRGELAAAPQHGVIGPFGDTGSSLGGQLSLGL